MQPLSQTGQLIDFISSDIALPDQVTHEAKRCILGYFAAAFAGVQSPIWQHAKAALDRLDAQGTHTVVGTPQRYRPEEAAFLNAIAGNVLDFDDTHIPTIIHPSSPLIPVLLSYAQQTPVSGSRFLRSVVMGVEVMCRLGMSTHPDSYKRGFHVTATCGAAGASVAHGLLRGLTQSQLTDCLALGCNLGSGLIVNLATPAKAISVGYAARQAYTTPTFIECGITGSSVPAEGAFGFLQAMSDSSDPVHLTQDLGSRWEILRVAQKPYPTGVVLNPVIDACLSALSKTSFDATRVKNIEVYGHSLLKDRADRPIVASVPDARLSVQHTVAVTLLRGLPGTDAFHEEAYINQSVVNLSKKVSVHVDDALDVEACRLTIYLENGGEMTERVTCGKGSLDNPLTDEDINTKCRTSAPGVQPSSQTESLLQDIWRLDHLTNAASILRHLD